MSKYSIAKELIATTTDSASQAGIDRDDAIEALMTLCIQDMKEQRGSDYTKSYLRYELDSVGSGGVYEIQKR
ncbi:MAG: hypothetical protein AB8B93_00990 [Pseudomonadales bacterium]